VMGGIEIGHWRFPMADLLGDGYRERAIAAWRAHQLFHVIPGRRASPESIGPLSKAQNGFRARATRAPE
jgi:hypothetical protein